MALFVISLMVLNFVLMLSNAASVEAMSVARDLVSGGVECSEVRSRSIISLAAYDDWKMQYSGADLVTLRVNNMAEKAPSSLVVDVKKPNNKGARPLVILKSASLSRIQYDQINALSVLLKSSYAGNIRVMLRDSAGRVFFSRRPMSTKHGVWAEFSRSYAADAVAFHGERPNSGPKPPFTVDHIQLNLSEKETDGLVEISRIAIFRERSSFVTANDEHHFESWLRLNCDYMPASKMKLELVGADRRRPISVGQEISIKLDRSVEDPGWKGVISLSVHRFGSSPSEVLKREVVTKRRSVVAIQASHRFNAPGLYGVTARITDSEGNLIAQVSRTALVWDPPNNEYYDTKPAFFGMMYPMDRFAQTRTEDLDLMRQAGVKIVRFPYRWSEIEKNGGRFDWRSSDRMMRSLAQRGFLAQPMVFYTPNWAAKPMAQSAFAAEAKRRPQWVIPADPRSFASFLRSAADRYRDQSPVWEIWNEPTESQHWIGGGVSDYLAIFQAAHGQIKSVSPAADVITAGIGLVGAENQDFASTMISRLGSVADGVAVHSYGGEVQAEQNIRVALNILENAGIENNVWLNETGYLADPGDAAAELRRSAVLVKTATIARYMNAENFTWFIFRNFETSANSSNDNYSLIAANGGVRPPLIAYSAVVRHLAGSTSVGKVNVSDEVVGYEFISQARRLIVTWLNDEYGQEIVSLPYRKGYSHVQLYDMYGGATEKLRNGAMYRQGYSPIFLVYDGEQE